jgi:hypothetical protein
MAVSTTQSIWRSGGGDQTRTAYCGNGTMIAQWYVGNVATQAGNLLNQANGQPIILPINAVITNISTTVASATPGTLDFGFTGYSSGTANPDALVNEQPTSLATATIPGASLGVPMSSSELVYITARAGATPGVGSAAGTLTYYVVDPLAGQQNV